MVSEPKLLLVCNREQAVSLSALFVASQLPVAIARHGEEQTLEEFQRMRPDVVVLHAGLTTGNPRALSAAMRATRGEDLQLILIGEEAGAVETEFDAADFAFDHFVRWAGLGDSLSSTVRLALQTIGDGPVRTRSLRTLRRMEVATDLAIREIVRQEIRALPIRPRRSGSTIVEPSFAEPASVRDRILRLWRNVEEGDYFAILDVTAQATPANVDQAYRARSSDLAGLPAELSQEFADRIPLIAEAVHEAYAVLADPRLREAYRLNLR